MPSANDHSVANDCASDMETPEAVIVATWNLFKLRASRLEQNAETRLENLASFLFRYRVLPAFPIIHCLAQQRAGPYGHPSSSDCRCLICYAQKIHIAEETGNGAGQFVSMSL